MKYSVDPVPKAVLTGDIIGSRKKSSSEWLAPLEEVLSQYGERPVDWEIFRGDSFQLRVRAELGLLAALHIKAAIHRSTARDVRIAIGVGSEDHLAPRVTESNGEAYVRSGDSFDAMKKHTLVFSSDMPAFDKAVNTMLRLAMLVADHWSSVVATTICASIEHPEWSQIELAEKLGKSQSSISEALKRGAFDEIMAVNSYYTEQIGGL